MHTHMHVYTHRHRYSIHPHTYMHTDKCIHIHNTPKHIYTSMGTHNTYLYACTHMCNTHALVSMLCTPTLMYVCGCTHTHLCTHTSTYTHVHRHTHPIHPHTCMHRDTCILTNVHTHVYTQLWGRPALHGELCQVRLNPAEHSSLSLTIVLGIKTNSQPSLGFIS